MALANLAKLNGLHPEVKLWAEVCLGWASYYGLSVTLTSGLRSIEEQKRLRERYERCLASPGGVYPGNPNPECRYPANRPGDSAHNFGMAWDSSVPRDQQWTWTYLREYAGFRVPSNDQVHAEVPNWRLYI